MTHASTNRPTGRGPREWARAFTGFYPPLAEDLVDLDPIARFLYSARSVILVISFQAALIAGLLALTDRRLELVPFLLVVVAYVVLHAISNLSNDYFGAKRGHDTDDSPRRRYTVHPLLSGAGIIGCAWCTTARSGGCTSWGSRSGRWSD
jgi:1,4-dihydroxy-2-naphthoate octaprenyltransferase